MSFRRTVWSRTRNRKSRNIVWIDTAMVLPRDTVSDFIRDVVVCLAVV